MTDITDRASEEEQHLRDDALNEQARRAGLPGIGTCVACAAELERAFLR